MNWTFEQRGEMWAVISEAGVTMALSTSRACAAIICYAVQKLNQDEIESFIVAINGN